MELSNCAHGATLDPLVGSAQDFNKFYAGLEFSHGCTHEYIVVINLFDAWRLLYRIFCWYTEFSTYVPGEIKGDAI